MSAGVNVRSTSSRPSRRHILKAGAAGTAGLALPAVGLDAAASTAARASASANLRRQDSVKLRVSVWLGDAEFAAMQELAGHFTEANPNVEIEFVNIIDGGPFGRDQLQRMIAGGEPPDLMMLNTGQFEGFGARGALMNLEERVAAEGYDLGIYWPAAVDGCRIDGDLYGLPKDISNVIYYLNTDMFDAAGVEVPSNEWTWDEFREVAKALTNGTDQWGTSIGNAVWAWLGFVASNGGEVLSEDRTECRLTTPETLEALKVYYGLLTEDEASVPPGALPQAEGASEQFLSGLVAMNVAGPWFRPNLVENEPFSWTIRQYPRPSAEAPTSVLYTDQWGISSATEHPDEAWALLTFFAGLEGQTLWADIYGSRSITPVQELAQSDAWLTYGGEQHREDNALILEQLDRTVPPPTNFDNGAKVENVWNEQLELVIVGQQDVEQAVQVICETITPILQGP